MKDTLKRELVAFLHTLAEESAAVIRPYFLREDLAVELKADASPVTEADRRAEAVLRDRIRKRYPEHGIIGEEYGRENEAAAFVWTLDPIDGTVSFASGCPLFGTLIGLLHEGRPMLGALNQPVLNQCCIGDHETTTVNGRPVRMRRVADLSRATLLATDLKHVDQYQARAGFDVLFRRVGLFRTWGDCYGYLLLATGGADIMLDPVMHPWDLIPLIPIIQGAGGTITTWLGNDAADGNSAVAAHPDLHAEVIRLLNTTG